MGAAAHGSGPTARTPADPVVAWLLSGDVAVQYRTWRELLGREDGVLRDRISGEGDGATLLRADGGTGHWGRGFYQPKWTSSHYTLLELKNLGISPQTPRARAVVTMILEQEVGADGGLDPTRSRRSSDACVNGMALSYASYFEADEDLLIGVVDFLLQQRLPDGGFNCRFNRGGARHSSVHTTVCVVEGITQYLRSGYHCRGEELCEARADAVEFLLRHRLYRSERSGEVMNPEFTRLHHPARWHFDVLRGLEALVDAGLAHDPRMEAALDVVRSRRRPDGRWTANRPYPGQTHLPAARSGEPHRWLTLTAMKVLDAYGEGSGGRG